MATEIIVRINNIGIYRDGGVLFLRNNNPRKKLQKHELINH